LFNRRYIELWLSMHLNVYYVSVIVNFSVSCMATNYVFKIVWWPGNLKENLIICVCYRYDILLCHLVCLIQLVGSGGL
jgi:hypothetical protein